MMYEVVKSTIKLSGKTSWLSIGGELPEGQRGSTVDGEEMSESDFPYRPNP